MEVFRNVQLKHVRKMKADASLTRKVSYEGKCV